MVPTSWYFIAGRSFRGVTLTTVLIAISGGRSALYVDASRWLAGKTAISPDELFVRQSEYSTSSGLFVCVSSTTICESTLR